MANDSMFFKKILKDDAEAQFLKSRKVDDDGLRSFRPVAFGHFWRDRLTTGAGHTLVTAYAVKRPGGEWSLMLINKDPTNAHDVNVEFVSSNAKQVAHLGGATTFVTFGAEQYIWHPDGQKSHADPDGPALKKDLNIKPGQAITLPKASVTVVRGGIS